jgi:hypothetical protein
MVPARPTTGAQAAADERDPCCPIPHVQPVRSAFAMPLVHGTARVFDGFSAKHQEGRQLGFALYFTDPEANR